MSETGSVTAEIFVTFMLFYALTYVKMDPKGLIVLIGIQQFYANNKPYNYLP